MNLHATGSASGPVLTAAEVAVWLRCSEETFRNKRRDLEGHGFPPKLPGVNGWSRAAVLRWIETNGATFLPAIDGADEMSGLVGALSVQLEGEYRS